MKLENIDIVDSDLIRKKFAGSYIVKSSKQIAIIEVSSAYAVDNILKKLKDLKIDKDDVKYIFITHIHLDHASGVGKLLQNLPKAKLIVHPSGAKHMIDPTKLISGAIAVYGKDVVEKDYGEILPCPENRVISCSDGEIFKLGDRELTTIFTPGHARHHISIYDNKTQGIFSGDSLGLSYPEMDIDGKRFYQPTTTPTAFEYDKMLESIDKMLSYNPQIILFTHYGISDEPTIVAKHVKKRLLDYKNIVESLPTFDKKEIKSLESKLKDYYISESRSYGIQLSEKEIIKLFEIDIKLNTMGLLIWKQREIV